MLGVSRARAREGVRLDQGVGHERQLAIWVAGAGGVVSLVTHLRTRRKEERASRRCSDGSRVRRNCVRARGALLMKVERRSDTSGRSQPT